MCWIDQVRRHIQINVEKDDKNGVQTLRVLAHSTAHSDIRSRRVRESTYRQENHQIILNLQSQDGLEMHQAHRSVSADQYNFRLQRVQESSYSRAMTMHRVTEYQIHDSTTKAVILRSSQGVGHKFRR